MEIKLNINFGIKELSMSNTCPYCLGSGKLKSMQRALTYDAGSVRAADTKVKCNHCNGTGRRLMFNE